MDPDRSHPDERNADTASSASLPPLHPFEEARGAAVREVAPFTRTGDPAMMRLAEEASRGCGTMVGMVSLLEYAEEWVVACVGTEAERIPRAVSFCAHAILGPDITVVEDASKDPRFRTNPFVTDEHHLRFYAGAPILDATGLPLGAVCVCDAAPMTLSSACHLHLRGLADAASAVLESRLLLADAHDRYVPEAGRLKTRARFDALLLTLLDLRSPEGSARR